MAYCTVDNVAGLTFMEFTQVSHPSTTEVNDFIANTAADLDGVAQAAGYTVPVTDAQAVALMKKYNTYGAAVAAWHAGYSADNEPARVTRWAKEYDDFIARLRRGDQLLPGSEDLDDPTDPGFSIASFYGQGSLG
jgi:hypothetical protein